tara:strand:- start:990 stop:1991 length:1002 start_codon:yes stop_codon:yes gene_type:complete
MKKILITGLSGFIGSWLSVILNSKGYKVYGVSLANNEGLKIYNKSKIAKLSTSYICNILDYEDLKDKFKKIKPDFVIHLAAEPIVLNSYKDPLNTLYTNILGTLNVIKLTSLYSSGKLVNFTSDKVYKNNNKNIAFNEKDFLLGNDPYSFSKSCSDLIGQNIDKNMKNIKISTIRCGNIIGGGDWSEFRLIPDYYRAYLNKKKLIIRNARHIRPWQHVITPISIIYQIIKMDKKIVFDTFNIGPNKKSVSVENLINKLNIINNNVVKINFNSINKSKESKTLKLNISKSKKIFQLPKTNLNSDLKILNEWYVKSLTTNDMHDFTIKQINDYLK